MLFGMASRKDAETEQTHVWTRIAHKSVSHRASTQLVKSPSDRSEGEIYHVGFCSAADGLRGE